ncbi:hypothetical protein QTP88_022757 [Uroleucon formosanum]
MFVASPPYPPPTHRGVHVAKIDPTSQPAEVAKFKSMHNKRIILRESYCIPQFSRSYGADRPPPPPPPPLNK